MDYFGRETHLSRCQALLEAPQRDRGFAKEAEGNDRQAGGVLARKTLVGLRILMPLGSRALRSIALRGA